MKQIEIEKESIKHQFIIESTTKMGLHYLKSICEKELKNNKISVYTNTESVLLVHEYKDINMATRMFSYMEYADYLDNLPEDTDILVAMLNDLFEVK